MSENEVLAIIFFWIGSCFGSFANVVIYRWPRGESVVRPRSRCFSCGKPISWRNNIPILAYFMLGGKCANCGAKYSSRYMLVELLTGLLFAFAALTLGLDWYLLEISIFLLGAVIVTFIDLDHFLIPDVITLPGIVIGLAGAFLNPDRSFVDSFSGALLGGGALWLVASVYYMIRKEEGMGGGDIKLLAWIGAVLGWKAIAFVVMSASLIGSVVGVIAAIRSHKGMKTLIPFGPYLVIGSVLWIFGGDSLGLWYLRIFFPMINISR